MLCPQLKQNLETIKTLKSELGLELLKIEKLFQDLKTGSRKGKEFKNEKVELMNKIKSLKTKVNLNIKTTENLMPTKIISAISPESKEIRFELEKQLEYWNDFYKDNNIDWVSLPEKIRITKEQQKEMKRLIAEFGFDKMIVIPENLAATGANYEKLHTLMSEDYNKTYQGDNFKTDGSFAGLKNKSDKLRIILTKDIEELDDDGLFKQTLGKIMDDLEATDGILTEKKLKGLDAATYLVYQREYFKRTGNHLDVEKATWLPEQIKAASGRVMRGCWSFSVDRLDFRANDPDDRGSALGCRLVGSFEIVTSPQPLSQTGEGNNKIL
jgi:hypothetical protein